MKRLFIATFGGRFCLGGLMLIVAFATAGAEDVYEVLRGDVDGFATVTPGKVIKFPRDHVSHEAYKLEWWYLTANLVDEKGNPYGIHWTLFRQALAPPPDAGGWASNQVWMAHAALSTPGGHVYEQHFARGGIGQAGVAVNEAGQFEAWLDNWRLAGTSGEPLPGTLTFDVAGHHVTLNLNASTPWVLQGLAGYSQKSAAGQASYYYSQPHIEVTGTIEHEGQPTVLSGRGWLDREWSSQPLAADQPGWDWISLHLDNGYALMAFRLRQDSGSAWVRGSYVNPQGVSVSLDNTQVLLEPIEDVVVPTATGERTLPLAWRVALPEQNLSWTVSALSPDNWLDTAFPYWEGPVEVSGSTGGVGYLELTGY